MGSAQSGTDIKPPATRSAWRELGAGMLTYAALLWQPGTNPQWQALVDRVCAAIVVLHEDQVMREVLCGMEGYQGPVCVRDLWYGPMYWVRTRGGSVPPQAPTPFGTHGVRACLRGFPDDIVEAEERLLRSAPAITAPAGPSCRADVAAPPRGAGPAGAGAWAAVTAEVGTLVAWYAHLIQTIPSRADYQSFVDRTFACIREHRYTLLAACTDDAAGTRGLCLRHVWHGLFSWPRTAGGEWLPYAVPPWLFPQAYLSDGVDAALDGFPEDIVRYEGQRFVKYVFEQGAAFDTMPIILPSAWAPEERRVVAEFVDAAGKADGPHAPHLRAFIDAYLRVYSSVWDWWKIGRVPNNQWYVALRNQTPADQRPAVDVVIAKLQEAVRSTNHLHALYCLRILGVVLDREHDHLRGGADGKRNTWRPPAAPSSTSHW